MQQEEGQEILKKQEIRAECQFYLSGIVNKDIELYRVYQSIQNGTGYTFTGVFFLISLFLHYNLYPH